MNSTLYLYLLGAPESESKGEDPGGHFSQGNCEVVVMADVWL